MREEKGSGISGAYAVSVSQKVMSGAYYCHPARLSWIVSEADVAVLIADAMEVGRMIHGLVRSLERTRPT
jgi:hypothetical protein